MKHWEFTGETKQHEGVTLRRIQLTNDCQWGNAGDLGGWIEKEGNLSGNAWVGDDAMVFGGAKVYGKACVFDEAQVFEDARVSGKALVYGKARVFGEARVYWMAQVHDGEWAKSPIQIKGSKHFVNECAPGMIRIGCLSKTIEEWMQVYKTVGEEQRYSDEEIMEYHEYITRIKKEQ